MMNVERERTMKKKPAPPAKRTEVRLLYNGRYRVEVSEDFESYNDALAFAKKLGLPTFETSDTFD